MAAAHPVDSESDEGANPEPEADETSGATFSVTDVPASANGSASQQLLPLPKKIAAVVGKTVIPMSDFHAIFDRKVAKYHSRGRDIPETSESRYRRSIIKRLIYAEVLRQELAKRGLKIDPATLAKRTADQKRGIRDWEKHLERRGESNDSLREMKESNLAEEAILKDQGALEVTAAEVEADYQEIRTNWKSDKERFRASHILVTEGEDKESQRKAKKKALRIHALVTAKGADFANIAKKYGEGPSVSRGGDIGIFTADRMAVEFSKQAVALKIGQISKPVRTKYGWHVIKLTGRWPPGELPIDALEDAIRERLASRKLHQGRETLKEELLKRYSPTDFVSPTTPPPPKRSRRRVPSH